MAAPPQSTTTPSTLETIEAAPVADVANIPDDPSLKEMSCVYFGYASNLSPRTMKQRCPGSLFISLATLTGWRWQINNTGYGNIVRTNEPTDIVYGSLCFLTRRDEMALDESEGVPWAYEKVNVKVKRVPMPGSGEEWKVDEGEEVAATTYVDFQRQEEGRIEKEYVVWIKKAIKDAVQCGMPSAYAEQNIESYLPKVNNEEVGALGNEEIMMVRTTQFSEYGGVATIPRGFASWTRG